MKFFATFILVTSIAISIILTVIFFCYRSTQDIFHSMFLIFLWSSTFHTLFNILKVTFEYYSIKSVKSCIPILYIEGIFKYQQFGFLLFMLIERFFWTKQSKEFYIFYINKRNRLALYLPVVLLSVFLSFSNLDLNMMKSENYTRFYKCDLNDRSRTAMIDILCLFIIILFYIFYIVQLTSFQVIEAATFSNVAKVARMPTFENSTVQPTTIRQSTNDNLNSVLFLSYLLLFFILTALPFYIQHIVDYILYPDFEQVELSNFKLLSWCLNIIFPLNCAILFAVVDFKTKIVAKSLFKKNMTVNFPRQTTFIY